MVRRRGGRVDFNRRGYSFMKMAFRVNLLRRTWMLLVFILGLVF